MSTELKPQPKYVEKRPRYFDGQYLKVDDFINEQEYHIDRQRRISQFLHISGILEGLQVTITKNYLQITPGAAIDDQGRQILLTDEVAYGETILKRSAQNTFEIDLSTSTLNLTDYNLSLAWDEVGSDEQSEGGSQENTRVYERPKIVIKPASEELSSSVLLAVLKGKGTGNSFDLDSTSRQYSGLKLPTTDGHGITLRSQNGASDRAILSGSLSITQNLQVDGKVGIGGAPAAGTEKLKVTGNLSVTGTSTLNGNTTITGNLTVAGQYVVQNNQDGGKNRGIFMWNTDDSNWGIYMGTSGNEKSLSGGKAVAGKNFTSHAIRLRTHSKAANGLIYENSNEDLNFSVRASDGSTYIRGNAGVGTDPTNAEMLKVGGNTEIAGTLSVTGNTNTLSVAGTSTLTGNVGIGGASGTEKLKVSGDAAIAGALSVTGTSTLSGNTTIAGNLTVAGKYVVQNNEDGGKNRGIFMWSADDPNWGIYMGTSGEFKSLSGKTAVKGKDFTSHAIRLRTNSNAENGLIYENSNEDLNFSVRASDGRTYIRGNAGVGTDPTNAEMLKVGGNTEIVGSLSVTGNTNTLSVVGTSTLTGNVGIGGAPGTEKLKVTGNAAIANSLTVGGSSTLSGNTTIAGNLTVAGKYVVQNNEDGGKNRGIFMWSADDPNWGIYMGTSGEFKSLSGKTAVKGKDFTSHAIRLRTYSNAENGLIYENSNEQLNFSVRASDGRTYIRGNVGIGTTEAPPNAKLVVQGNGGTYRIPIHTSYAYGGTYPNSSSVDISDVSIYASDRIVCSLISVFSDKRIKNIQGRSESASDLHTLLGIEITDFRYKDISGKGNALHKKVIGQQVEKVFPQSVSKHIDLVPDIYQLAPITDGWVALATDLKPGDRVKLIAEQGEEGIYEVMEVAEEKFRTAFKPKGEKVFVFGREVNDFRIVDYDAIAMLNVSATQELYKRLDRLQLEVEQLQASLYQVKPETLADQASNGQHTTAILSDLP